MAEEGFKRKLAAILSADVEGYSRLMDDDEEATVRTLTAYRNAITDLTQQFRGRVVDSPGDNILAEFSSVVDSVNCAVEIQRELAERNAELPYNRKMEFRIGVNLGDVIEEDGRIYGDGVNIAARVESMAEAGAICISSRAYDQVANKLGLEYENLGDHQFKNISTPIRVYRVLSLPGAAAHRTPPMKVASEERMAYPLPDKPSIAVLPFDNMSGDPKQEYFSDGITDQIITSLSIIPRLFVIARNSTFTYKGKAVKVQKVAEELGVRYVLEGSVQRSESRIRILVQLIDATTGHHLWSERYDRDLQDIFELQDEIAMKIMTALQVKLTEGEYASAVAGTTSNLKAMEFFWRAEECLVRFAEEDNAKARRLAEEAIELDSNFSGAWALLGFAHLMDVSRGWTKSPAQSIRQAGECAQKAIALNDSCAKAHALVGAVQLIQRKHDEAIRYGRKAVALNPNDPEMIAVLAGALQFSGRFEEAISLIKKAMRLTPYYHAWFLSPLSWAYILTEHYTEAIEAGKLMIERSRKGEFDPLEAHLLLASAYAGLGKNDKAGAHAEEVLKINPNFSSGYFLKILPYKNPVHLKSRIALYRKAGLP